MTQVVEDIFEINDFGGYSSKKEFVFSFGFAQH